MHHLHVTLIHFRRRWNVHHLLVKLIHFRRRWNVHHLHVSLIRFRRRWNVKNVRARAAASFLFRLEDLVLANSTVEVELCRRAALPGCSTVDWATLKSRIPPARQNMHGGGRIQTTWEGVEAAVGECAAGLREECAAIVRDARLACREDFSYSDC